SRSATACARPGTPAARCNTSAGEERSCPEPALRAKGMRLMRLAASLPVPPDLPACQRAARRMEELGYDSVWLADTGAGPHPFVLAAALAGVTSRPPIGTPLMP